MPRIASRVLKLALMITFPNPLNRANFCCALKTFCAAAKPRAPPRDDIRMGPCVFNITRGELKRDDEAVKLTERERDLMRLFAQRIGNPVPRHELSSDDSTGSERAIDVQINRLRRKIESDPSNPVYLQTVRGKGYILYTD